jgi:hypothetical protein
MSGRLIGLIAAVLGVATANFAAGTTITFTGHTANSDVTDVDDGAYGSHVSEETDDFVTSDGTGATPNIALLWETATGPNADIWEFHDARTFSPLDPGTTGDRPRPTGVAQLDVNIQNGVRPADPTIDFIPDPGYAVTVHSLDIGTATDLEPYEGKNAWIITLTRVSDDSVVWTHTTQVLDAGDTEQVKVGFTGQPGEQYRLRFDRGPRVNHPRGGIDNLSFSQSERKPLTPEQFAKAKLGVQERIDQLSREMKKADKTVEAASESAARIAAQLRTEYEQGNVQETDVKRLEQARARVDRAAQAAAKLARQMRATKKEHAELLKEEPADSDDKK